MKRSILCALALAMALSGTANGAIPTKHDIVSATSLADENVMSSNIGQAISSTPLGAIVAFNYNSEPLQYTSLRNGVNVPDYVLCDGRAIPAQSDLCKVAGHCGTTPNLNTGGYGTSGYGFFLRGGSSAQQKVADKFETHNHDMRHTHQFAGELNSDGLSAYIVDKEAKGKIDDTKVEGTAKGQDYTDTVTSTGFTNTGYRPGDGTSWSSRYVVYTELHHSHWGGGETAGAAPHSETTRSTQTSPLILISGPQKTASLPMRKL